MQERVLNDLRRYVYWLRGYGEKTGGGCDFPPVKSRIKTQTLKHPLRMHTSFSIPMSRL